MILENMDVTAIQSGYGYDGAAGSYICCVCGAIFINGEVYPTEDGRFLLAEKAVGAHMSAAHGDRLESLLDGESKYLSLTDNQKRFLRLVSSGKTDGEIASLTGVTASTVRHQRFQLREKAKQAKMYLAVYGLAMGKGDGLMPIHNDMVKVDDRFIITGEERDKIIKNSFESLEPMRLLRFPAREKKKVVILTVIAEKFEKGIIYTEKEVNAILKDIYIDFATLRRYLVEYKYLDRKRDCSEYWVR